MTLFRPSAPRVPRDENYVPGERCESCGKGEEIGFLALCEHCDNAYHGVCLDPPLRQKPDPEWNCPRCLVGDTQFGFEEGGLYSLKQFQEKANEFKQSYFENRLPWDPVLQCPRPVTEDDVEREFWRLVASLEETVEVEYGADIHCTTHGSGFPTAEKNPLDPYSRDPWNLNLLPLHQDSLFRHIKSDISGMTVPWVYVGMTFSTFCWHTEDHYAYSANYQHFGDTKTWYGIPSADAEKFEAAMREAVPELFEAQPDLLFQLVTLLPPEQLKKSGVRVYALDQRAGQFVITFPQAYHAGFNHGFNFNEAVNFAPSDWEPFGLDGVDRLQQFRKQPCFSHDELLWTAAEGTSTSTLTIANARWLAPALKRIHDREKSRRKAFIREHIEAERHDCPLHQADSDQRVEIKTERTEDGSAEGAPPTQPKESAPAVKVACPLRFEVDDRDVPEEEYQCTYCKAYAYLTRFKCLASGKVLCLLDAGNFQCCEQARNQRFSGANHVLVYRKSEEAMDAMYQKVAEKARQPEAWEEKFEKLLEEEARPSLKALRSLLNEGEKIPWHLPSLAELRQYVDRCQEWVDEASNYIVRKPHARRKNERSHARKSVGNIQQAVEDREQRFDYMNRLVEQGVQLGFESPEIGQLRERVEAARDFQRKAVVILENKVKPGIEEVEELLDIGRGFNVEFLETELLAHRLDQMKWDRRAREARGTFLTLKEASDLLEEAQRLVIPPYNEHLKFWQEKVEQGRSWEAKASELTSADSIHYAQLEALSNRAKEFLLPVKPETRDAVELILQRQREAQRQILELLERSKSEDYRKRPTYQEVCEMMKRLESINSKPNGTIDLDRELKRHEDWMRRGKKLFGKTNAPLHILKSHMEYVLERNQDCLDIEHDKPRHPAEPQSREPSPGDYKKMKSWEDPRNREVFCICRKQEAGMMIECELCHEW